MMNNVIFTDGSSRGNPGKGGWAAIIVEQVESGKSKVFEIGGGEKNVTNNQMELRAAIEALKNLQFSIFNSQIYTDSSYLINGITKWVKGWQANDWKTKTKQDVLNRELWEELYDLTDGKRIEWKYLGGHRGIAGNERCDEIATSFAASLASSPESSRRAFLSKLYNGPLDKYPLDILNIAHNPETSEKRTKDRTRSKAKAYSYVSKVDGIISTHQTWVECEAVVKGAKGAKYKKALSPSDEQGIINEWKD